MERIVRTATESTVPKVLRCMIESIPTAALTTGWMPLTKITLFSSSVNGDDDNY